MATTNRPQTAKVYFFGLQITFWTIIASQIIFLLVSLFLKQKELITNEEELNTIFTYLVPVLALGAIGGSSFLTKTKINQAKANEIFTKKMTIYRSVLIIRSVILEVPTSISIVAYLLTGNLLFLGIALLMLALYIPIKPSREKAASELELSPEEREKINSLTSDEIIAYSK